MAERKKLELISSVEIMNMPMKKQRFIVDEMIYPGMHILSGDPKIGKSWSEWTKNYTYISRLIRADLRV